jgi:5-methylcytosine-specific restriction endonuclease McrA
MIDYEGIAYDLRSDIDTIKSIINDFDLFMIEDDMFGSKSIENRIQERSEKSSKARTSALSKWGSNTNQAKRSERLTEARKKATHTKDEWEAMRLFFGECVKCGNKEDLVKDHITPIYQGGSDGLENLQPLCRKCNASKGADSTDYRSIYCDKNDCEMPTTYFKTPAIKERKEIKGKESKESKPSIDEFLSFCKDDMIKNGMNFSLYEYSLKSKFSSWVENNWKDGNNKPIKSWKSKIRNTIPFLKPISLTTSNSYQDKVNQAVKAFKPIQQYDNDL